MKKLIFLPVMISLILVSCESDPEASFSATPGDPVVGELVLFNNNSVNGDRFEWDFGDGYGSDEVHPSHTYTASGSFEVVLKVWSHNDFTDEASLTIEVKIPTLLEIEVLEFYELYPVEGAIVILYSTLSDWENETNYVNEGFTDAEGKVVFADLDNFVYYVDVWEATHDNYALKEEDVAHIRTPEIMPNKINRFTAKVDYVDHGKGAGRRSGNLIIKKPERKAIDQKQPEPYSEEGWQILYDKSVRKK